jgi:hypothetical protein
MRRRVRRWTEAAVVLLAFPVAVALTVVAISSPASSRPSSTASGAQASVAPLSASVALAGAEPIATYALADRIAAAGYRVTTVEADRDANSLSATTVVVYYERERRGAADGLVQLLRAGTTRRDQVFEPGVDLTIILGKDLQRT